MTALPQLEHELVRAHRRAVRRRRRVGWIAPAVAVGATLAIAAVFVIALRHGGSTAAPTGTGDIVLRPTPLNQHAPTNADISTTVGLLRQRYAAELPGIHVSRVGDQVVLRGVTASSRPRALALAQPGRLAFFDWEANALLPSGVTVASGLSRQDRAAMATSQGATGAPGISGSGGYSLYTAVNLASRQPARTYPSMSHRGPQLYLFGRPRSGICRQAGTASPSPTSAARCYVAGPAPSLNALTQDLPLGTAAAGDILTVPPGTVVLQAADANAGRHLAPDNASARFFVLRDDEALSNAQITHPAAHIDQAGSPDVTFDFTRTGTRAFQNMTATIARRGAGVSSAGLMLNQHFAIAIDGQLLTVPQIDFKAYPDGVNTSSGDMTGAFTTASARDLATILRFGPLPVRLTPG